MRTASMLRFLVVVPVLGVALALAADEAATLRIHDDEPRAYGYRIGDVVTRRLEIEAPAGLALDAESLPQIGRRGRALELRRVDWNRRGDRYRIELQYQVLLAPHEVRTLEMPSFTLRFPGAPRPQEARIEAWPVTVAALVPVEVSPRRGLGELQPDRPPPPIATGPAELRLAAYGAAGLLLLGYLGVVYLGLPWWSRRHRPFGTAWQALRALPAAATQAQARAAIQRMHDALNRSAGQVVFESGLDRFLAAQPRFEPLRAELARFFRTSREAFFGDAGKAGEDLAWLRELCRRCRDLERGAA